MIRSALFSLPLLLATAAFGATGFERVLIPVWTHNLPGAFGSRWVAQLTGVNISAQQAVVKTFPGIVCGFQPCPGDPGYVFAWRLEGSDDFTRGRFLYVTQGRADDLQFSLLAFDSSRMNASFGSQVPVVREREFSNRSIVLSNVPLAQGFRIGLRIYGHQNRPMPVTIRIERSGLLEFVPWQVQLEPYPNIPQGDDSRPSFALIDVNALLPANFMTDPPFNPFPGPGPALLTIRVSPVSSQDFIWAFVTVTHDETQHFTAIGPQ
jgi:hypothetical protein